MSRLLPVCLLLCLSVAAPAAEPGRPAAEPSKPEPSKIEAHYDVLKGGIKVAVMTETYVRLHDHYELESISQAVWPLTMFKNETIWVNSAGTVTAQGLRPKTYTAKRKLDEDRNTRADLSWERREITLNDKAGPRTQPLPAGTQDRLSAMYQLMFLPLRDMHALKFYMTNGSKVDDYTFAITQGQSVTVPFGTFDAVYLATLPEKNASRTEIWVATEPVNFPYKMVITEGDGGQFTQLLTSINITP